MIALSGYIGIRRAVTVGGLIMAVGLGSFFTSSTAEAAPAGTVTGELAPATAFPGMLVTLTVTATTASAPAKGVNNQVEVSYDTGSLRFAFHRNRGTCTTSTYKTIGQVFCSEPSGGSTLSDVLFFTVLPTAKAGTTRIGYSVAYGTTNDEGATTLTVVVRKPPAPPRPVTPPAPPRPVTPPCWPLIGAPIQATAAALSYEGACDPGVFGIGPFPFV